MSDELPIEIDVYEVQRLLAAGEIVLLDCREEEEWQVARIDNAVLIPMSRLRDAADDLQQCADRRTVVHCHHGRRSLQVTQWMRDNGFPQTQSMAAGIDAWSQEIDPSVARY